MEMPDYEYLEFGALDVYRNATEAHFNNGDQRGVPGICINNIEKGMCRPVLNQINFDNQNLHIVKDRPSKIDYARNAARRIAERELDSKKLLKRVEDFFPIYEWARNYNLRSDLLADLVCGLTIAFFHVPQALGYALLVGVNLVNGLYVALFPMLMYAIFGTSRHNSIGALAVVCVMTSGVVQKAHVNFPDVPAETIVTILALFVGIFQVIMGLLNMGGLSVFLSEQFVSGFTAGVAIHTGSSQLGGLFGLNLNKYSGPFLLIRTYADFAGKIDQTHVPTICYAIATVMIILAVKFFIDPLLLKKFRMPFPIELVVVIASVAISRAFDFGGKGFLVVDDIPNSLQAPRMPAITSELVIYLLSDALMIAIISFAVDISLGRIWAQEKGYVIRPNQECFALGLSNFFGSFFGCFPVGASVPRSALQCTSGGRTQLVSFINSLLMLFVILYLGSLLEGLPKVVLSSIIVVSLKKVIMQVRDFKNFWSLSMIDGHVWLVTFFAVIIIDVVRGLVVGVVFSLLTLIFKIQRPKTFLLGRIQDSDYYVPLHLYEKAREVPGVKIFQYGGPLHFGNTDFFHSELVKKCSQDFVVRDQVNPKPIRYIILDCSRITFSDGSAALLLKDMIKVLKKQGVNVYIACCSANLFQILEKAKVLEAISGEHFYPSVHDAVLHTYISKQQHRALAVIGRQASFQETFGPDSLQTEHFHIVDLSDEHTERV